MDKENYIVEVYIIENTSPGFELGYNIFKIFKKQTKWIRAYHCNKSEIPKLFDRIETYYTGNLLTEYGIVLKLEYIDSNIVKCYVKPFRPIIILS